MPISKLPEVGGRRGGSPFGRPSRRPGTPESGWPASVTAAYLAYQDASRAADELRKNGRDKVPFGQLMDAERAEESARKVWRAMVDGRDKPHKFYLVRMRLNSGGYDSGGSYWGIGQPLFRYESEDGDVNGYIRAASREAAKSAVLAEYPSGRFFR